MDLSPTRARYFFVLGNCFFTRENLPPKMQSTFTSKTKKLTTKNFWDCFHVTFSDLPELRYTKKKSFLAKGVSAESSVTPKESKNIQGYGPSSSFGTQSATAKRGIHTSLQKKPSNRKSSKRVTWMCPSLDGCTALCSLDPDATAQTQL